MKKLITHALTGSNIHWIFALLIAVTASSLILKTPDGSNPQLDSLKNALNNAKHDTTRVNILLQIAENIYDDNVWPQYNRQALDIAEKNILRSKGAVLHTFKKVKADALNNIGYIYNLQGHPDKALEYFLQSLEIQKEINDKRGIAESLNNIGFIYHNQGNPDKALEYYLQSLQLDKETNNKQGIATSLNNIGAIYDNQDNPDKALDYSLQSLEIRKEINDKQGHCNVIK